MRYFAIAAFVAIFGISSASAEIYAEEVSIFSGHDSSYINVNSLPATSAGPSMTRDDDLFENPEFN